MAKEIKQRIVLEGEKEYSAAIKEANRNLKTLRSELKAETAEMGRNASQSEKSEAKAKSLKKQIAEQEKIVKAYRQALQEVREKYADNEDAIASWEQKLNNARTTLANMKNDLEGVGDSFRQMDADSASAVTATKSVADAIGRIGKVGDTVADSIEAIFTGMVSAVSRAISEVWGMITETAAKANNWTDIAGYWNTDPQVVQQWARAVKASQNEFGDLTNAVSKISYGNHERIRELTGVSWAGDIDQWQYAMDVMSSLSDMDYANRTAALEEIFGEKRASKMMDLLNDWKTIMGLLPTFNGNETGYGMSDRELSSMDDLYVKVGAIEAKWEALKDNVAAGLGIATMGLLINVEGMLDGVADFLNAENEQEREAALEKIRINLEEFFRKLGEIIQECLSILHDVGSELQNSDDPVTKAIGDILVGLTEALQWMIDHQEEVKIAFAAIFGVWLLMKLAAIGSTLSGIVANIQTIKTFKDWKMPTDGGGTGNGNGTGTGAGNGTGTGTGTGTENVTTQNVTTQNVTTENLSAANITTGNTTTENVGTMYVGNMIGGNGLPGTGNNGTPGLNGGGGNNLLPGGSGTGLNGYVPIMIPGNGGNGLLGSGDNTFNLGSGDNTFNLGSGDQPLGLPSGEPFEMGPNDYSIDGQPGGGTDIGTGAEGPLMALFRSPAMKLLGGAATFLWAMLPDNPLFPQSGSNDLFDSSGNPTDEYWNNAMSGLQDDFNSRMNALHERYSVGFTDIMDDPELLNLIFGNKFPNDEDLFSYLEGVRGWKVYEEPEPEMPEGRANLYADPDAPVYHRDRRTGELYQVYDDFTEDMIAAAEKFWDRWRDDGDFTDEEFEEYHAAFKGNEHLFDRMEELMNGLVQSFEDDSWQRIDDLPSEWWLNSDQWNGGNSGSAGTGQDGITHTDLANFNSLPARLQAAAQNGTAAGVSGIRVQLDGATVGRLVAPYVSQMIAREIV